MMETMFTAVEAAAAQEIVCQFLLNGDGDLPERLRRVLGRILLESQFALEAAQHTPRGDGPSIRLVKPVDDG